MSQQPKMLRVREIAERLSVSNRAVHYWIEFGYLPAVRVHERGMWLVREKDLEAALRSNNVARGRRRTTHSQN